MKPSASLDSLAAYAYTRYSPRPDDFYFGDGDGGYVTKLELPDDEKELVVAEGFLDDIRRLENAIEVSPVFEPLATTSVHANFRLHVACTSDCDPASRSRPIGHNQTGENRTNPDGTHRVA